MGNYLRYIQRLLNIDRKKNSIASLTYHLLWALVIIDITMTILASFTLQLPGVVWGINALFAVILLSNFYLLNRGWTKLAAFLLTSELWIYITLVLFFFGGNEPAILTSFFVLILVGAILIGKKGIIFTTIGALCSSVLIAWIDFSGGLPQPIYQVDRIGSFFLITTNFVLVGIIVSMWSRNIQNALDLAQATESKFRHIVQNSLMGIHIYHLEENQRLIFSGYNPAANNILKLNHETIIGKTLEEAFPPLSETEIPTVYKRLAREGGNWSTDQINYQDEHISGAYEVYAFQTTPNTIAVMFNDITNRLILDEKIRQLNIELEERVAKRTAELQEANENLESFAYSISHDLRAPLRAINGYASIMRDELGASLNHDGMHYLNIIQSKTIEMSQLIDDLLHFSRTGRIPLAKEVVFPNEIVNSVISSLEIDYSNRQVEFQIANLPECLADPALLRQVYHNLITNALKFTRTREKAIIEIGFKTSDGPVIYFVRDNGIGFDMQFADKVFGVFTRLNRGNNYEGTGVGLAIVRRIIMRHGGVVWAEGALDQGAAIYFTLDTI